MNYMYIISCLVGNVLFCIVNVMFRELAAVSSGHRM